MRFKTSMLEYCKVILEKLSFSRDLFRKEYRKSFRYLNPEERILFRKWVRRKFKMVSSEIKITI
jgi:hypothetical protein